MTDKTPFRPYIQMNCYVPTYEEMRHKYRFYSDILQIQLSTQYQHRQNQMWTYEIKLFTTCIAR